ncbi:sensor histidine kinase [Athalassotoga saccharophila]|uniref:sensor histidine kinase n=1 Tax=Athalassotoga saccharophila TaxID=1441386 RepID=UPI00137A12B3|nr:HAMP domain-containing sensor histidine kinase [Athalassotoga saccharophila]BBJ27941.1 signal transduction histidine-protein kinase BaeS [Athalassotoga saccharophila]
MATRSKNPKLSTKFVLYVIVPVIIMGILMVLAQQRIFENRFENFTRTYGKSFYGFNPYFPEQRLKNIERIKRETAIEIFVSFGIAFGASLAVSIILAEVFQKKISDSLKSLSKGIERIKSNQKPDFSNVKFSSEITDLAADIESLAEKLSERSLARKAMTSSVYHEIMTPLTVIRMELEAVRDDVVPYSKEMVDKMLLNIDHITEVLRDLKSIEGDDLSYIKEEFDAGFETEEIFKSFIPILESRNQKFSTDFKSVLITADKRRFKQAIFNLLSNAVKYTKVGGRISISVDRDKVVISNEFEGDPPRQSDFGTGLKLVKDFCEYHGFKFEITKSEGYVVSSILFKN